ncbi:probable MCA1-Metacaspase [Serendipita indica DSM 11827]|uniref:Probable MCA1-Metacaspase n=1 Tax=Serendipita indica (strain DSM 11827) TaxID=1109443 RepID=G4TFV3_SERID|nr:probable MCA1-Metacaspase [Serendipita indica DSM 11827]
MSSFNMRRYKALTIGISYVRQDASCSVSGWGGLDGPVNDAERMESFLRDKLKYENVVIITDKNDPNEVSRRNILEKFNWLVDGAGDGDVLFLHYSGHGWQRPTRSHSEADNLDETIVPADCPFPANQRFVEEPIPECGLDCPCAPNDPLCWKPAYQGMIHDNEMRDILVKPLRKGVHLVSLFDCCHSGSILDLRYHYLPHGTISPMFSAKGLTTIPPELRNSAKPQLGPHSRFDRFLDLRYKESSPCVLGEALGASAGMAFGHGMPVASLQRVDDHMRNKSLQDVAVSHVLGEALGISARMAFGYGVPASSHQVVDAHMHSVRRRLQQDMAVPCALGEALGTSAGMAFGHGMPIASLRMTDDYMHAMRNESERGVAVSLSACIDHDVVFELRGRRGMLTTFFIQMLEEHNLQVCAEMLIDEMYSLFHSAWKKDWSDQLKSSPYPVLSSNRLLNLSSIFIV